MSLRASFGRGAACFFHSASLRKKSTGQFATLSKHRASPGHPWPVLSRCLRLRRLISVAYQTHPLTHPALGLHPAGARRGRLYITVRYANLPAAPRHTPAGPSGAGPPSVRFAIHVSGSSGVRRGPPIRPRARRGGSHEKPLAPKKGSAYHGSRCMSFLKRNSGISGLYIRMRNSISVDGISSPERLPGKALRRSRQFSLRPAFSETTGWSSISPATNSAWS